MSDRLNNHGYAAFTPEDREDAKRGRPPGSLEAYAAERGIDFRGRKRLAGFRGAQPEFEEEQHNLLRGVLPGGRFGILFHELLRTHGPEGPGLQGTYYGIRTSSPGWWRPRMPDRHDIPILGDFLNPKTDNSPRKPFEDQGAWSPVTTVATPVPETVARMDEVVFTVTGRAPKMNTRQNVNLADHGLPGWRAKPGVLEPEQLIALLTDPVRAALAELAPLSYAQVVIHYGMVTVKRNGYVMEPSALDALATTTCRLADALAEVCMRGRSPQPFAQPLAPCRWTVRDPKASFYGLPKAWEDDFRDFAGRHGYELEEPADWHERFASVPLPGRVLAVMRDPSGMRVLFPVDVPVFNIRAVRGAMAFETDAADTPPGGIFSPDSATTVAVRDGVGVVWTANWFGYAREADGLVDHARAAAAAAGIAVAA